nr:hypothetical protein [Tanacetum cinerariifolium]
RDTVQLKTAVSTISHEYLLEFTYEYGISKALHPELPGLRERIVDFPEGKVDERVFPIVVDWRTSAPKDEMPAENTYSPKDVMVLNTHHMDLFNLICAPNPTKVKTGAHSSGVPSNIERSPLDFANKNPFQQSTRGNGPEDQGQEAVVPEVPPPNNVTTTGVAPEAGQAKGIAATGPHSTHEGKSLAAIGLGMRSTCPVPASRGAPVDVSDPDLLSFADPQSLPTADVARSSKGAPTVEDPESENTSFTSMVESPESIYRPEWGVTNGFLLDAPEACQDVVDHIAPPGYFSELRHLHNDDFLKQYNVNLARKVALGSQLRLRFEQEAKPLKKFVAQVSTLQAQVTGEEKLKDAFEEFKQYEDNRVEKSCAKIDTRLDALSIYFDDELYPHMLTAITCRRWVIGHGLRLAVMKCGESTELRRVFANVVSAGIAKGMSEGLKYGVEHGKANLSLEAIEVYDPKAEARYIADLHALKDLKYPIVDQLESLKDAPMDVIMASLHLESDTGDDAPQWIRELHSSSSQLKIHVYPEVRDPTDPWACKEDILLADAIAANVSRAEKKKKCRVVCCTHGVGFAHHARSDGVPVSVTTVAPQGLAILLADAATQMETSENGVSPWLLRSNFYMPCIAETSHSTACRTLNICICNISTDVRDEHCM